jgi:hypothetical protein
MTARQTDNPKPTPAVEKHGLLSFVEATPRPLLFFFAIVLELAALLQKSVSDSRGRLAGRDIPKGRIKNAVTRSVRYLKANYTESVNMKNLANDLHLSYGYFVRTFKSLVGVSPKTFLQSNSLP